MQEKLKDFSKRLEILMQSAGIENVNQLSKTLGYSRPTKLYSMLENASLPSIETVADILLAFPGVSARWLVLGEGEPGGNSTNIENAGEIEQNGTAPFEILEIRKNVDYLLEQDRRNTIRHNNTIGQMGDIAEQLTDLWKKMEKMEKREAMQ